MGRVRAGGRAQLGGIVTQTPPGAPALAPSFQLGMAISSQISAAFTNPVLRIFTDGFFFLFFFFFGHEPNVALQAPPSVWRAQV